MSTWIKKFESIVEYKLSKSPFREIDDVDIYMDYKEYMEFSELFKFNPNLPNHNYDIDTVMFMGVKFLIHKVYNL